jgi:transcriptional regulator with XRE-family HTH domain
MIHATVVSLPGLLRQRLLAALTQEQLAERAGVQRPTVSRLETGGDARPTTVRKLADVLGCSPRDLIEPE